MKRSNLSGQHNIILQVHIADGFYDDCDELLSKCTQLQTLDYQSFCSIWKEMNFGYIYQGRSSGAEIAELSEELVHIAKHYLIRNTSNFEESVAGLFLMYGLLCLQPYNNFAWLRLTPDDVPALKRIEIVARREKRMDVLYILGDILINRCQYHAAERERGLEKSFRKYLEGCMSINKLGVRPKGVFYRQNEELDIIRDLGTLTRQYVRAKNNVVSSISSPSLNYIDESLADDLNVSLKKIINGLSGDTRDSDETDDDSVQEHYEAVTAIKHKAMTNTVDPVRHITAVQDRKNEKVKKHKSDLKSPKGKIKGGSPRKPIPGATMSIPGLTGKRKMSPNTNLQKKPKVAYGWQKITSDKSSSDETELNLQEFSQTSDEPPAQENKLVEPENIEIINVQSDNGLDIELGSLPVIIRTEKSGESIEIEIFDEYRGDPSEEETNTLNSQENPSSSNKTDTNNIKIIKKKAALSVKLKQPETCDLKRSVLKSKFKKMGILPAANFVENNKS